MKSKWYMCITIIFAVINLCLFCTADELRFPEALKNTYEKDMKYWTNSCQLLFQASDLIVEGRVVHLERISRKEHDIKDWYKGDIGRFVTFEITKIYGSTYDEVELSSSFIQKGDKNRIYILCRGSSHSFMSASLNYNREYIVWLHHSPISDKDGKLLGIPTNSTYTVLGGEFGVVMKTDFNKAYYDNNIFKIIRNRSWRTKKRNKKLLKTRFNITNIEDIQKSAALLCEAFSTNTKSNRIELIQKANNLLSYNNPSNLNMLKDLRRFKIRNKNPDALASFFDLSILSDEEE